MGSDCCGRWQPPYRMYNMHVRMRAGCYRQTSSFTPPDSWRGSLTPCERCCSRGPTRSPCPCAPSASGPSPISDGVKYASPVTIQVLLWYAGTTAPSICFKSFGMHACLLPVPPTKAAGSAGVADYTRHEAKLFQALAMTNLCRNDDQCILKAQNRSAITLFMLENATLRPL